VRTAYLGLAIAIAVGAGPGCHRAARARRGDGPVAEGPRRELPFRTVVLKIRARTDERTGLSEAEVITLSEGGIVTHVLYGPGRQTEVPVGRPEIARAEVTLEPARFEELKRLLAKARDRGFEGHYDLNERIAVGTKPFAEAWLEVEAANLTRKRIHFTSAMSSTAPLELTDFVEMLTRAVIVPRSSRGPGL
jgi:hypothetical protein